MYIICVCVAKRLSSTAKMFDECFGAGRVTPRIAKWARVGPTINTTTNLPTHCPLIEALTSQIVERPIVGLWDY